MSNDYPPRNTIRRKADFFCLNTCKSVSNGLISAHVQRGSNMICILVAVLCLLVIALVFATGWALDKIAPVTPKHPDLNNISFPVKFLDSKEIERRE
jgi:hypothetical protein